MALLLILVFVAINIVFSLVMVPFVGGVVFFSIVLLIPLLFIIGIPIEIVRRTKSRVIFVLLFLVYLSLTGMLFWRTVEKVYYFANPVEFSLSNYPENTKTIKYISNREGDPWIYLKISQNDSSRDFYQCISASSQETLPHFCKEKYNFNDIQIKVNGNKIHLLNLSWDNLDTIKSSWKNDRITLALLPLQQRPSIELTVTIDKNMKSWLDTKPTIIIPIDVDIFDLIKLIWLLAFVMMMIYIIRRFPRVLKN